MKEYPILFQPDMVRAKMEGRKNQTRRLTGLKDINQEPDKWRYEDSYVNESGDLIDIFHHQPTNMFTSLKCPYGAPGSILWTRETYSETPDFASVFMADISSEGEYIRREYLKYGAKWAKWKPSIHMPKDVCRIYSQNTGVRVQRLQDISEEDAIAEGIACLSKDASFMEKEGRSPTWKYGIPDKDGLPGGKGWAWEDWKMSAKEAFRALIEKINGPDIWEQNPWVRAISFRVLSTTGRPENLQELCVAL